MIKVGKLVSYCLPSFSILMSRETSPKGQRRTWTLKQLSWIIAHCWARTGHKCFKCNKHSTQERISCSPSHGDLEVPYNAKDCQTEEQLKQWFLAVLGRVVEELLKCIYTFYTYMYNIQYNTNTNRNTNTIQYNTIHTFIFYDSIIMYR